MPEAPPTEAQNRFHPAFQKAREHSRSVLVETFLQGFTFGAPQVPVISNVRVRPYEPDMVRATLAEQIGNSVRWLDSMLYLLEKPDATFEEVGPGQVLTKLLKQIQKRAKGTGQRAEGAQG